MVDRYAADAFIRYCQLRRLSPAQARAELECLDDLVLMNGSSVAEGGRWAVTSAPAEPAALAVGRSSRRQPGGPSWTK